MPFPGRYKKNLRFPKNFSFIRLNLESRSSYGSREAEAKGFRQVNQRRPLWHAITLLPDPVPTVPLVLVPVGSRSPTGPTSPRRGRTSARAPVLGATPRPTTRTRGISLCALREARAGSPGSPAAASRVCSDGGGFCIANLLPRDGPALAVNLARMAACVRCKTACGRIRDISA